MLGEISQIPESKYCMFPRIFDCLKMLILGQRYGTVECGTVVVYLHAMHEVLGSNPRTTYTKKVKESLLAAGRMQVMEDSRRLDKEH